MLLVYWCVSFGARLSGVLLDQLWGDPLGRWHPICFIGRLVSFFDGKLLKADDGSNAKRLKGALLVTLVVLIAGGVSMAVIYLSYHIGIVAGFICEAVLVSFLLAAKSLKQAALGVYAPLLKGDVATARSAVSMVVGRDTERLSKDGIIMAAVETVAENTSDGITAPLMYTLAFGTVAGVVYKAVNTMDSMIAYKNEKYVDFGRCAAKMDDALNFLPSRITGLLMVVAALICGYDVAGAWRIYRRDRLAHSSPNSAQTESACAGALGVRLAGDAWYGGVKISKPYIGDFTRPVEAEDIRRACRLMSVTYLLAVFICVAVFGIVCATVCMV